MLQATTRAARPQRWPAILRGAVLTASRADWSRSGELPRQIVAREVIAPARNIDAQADSAGDAFARAIASAMNCRASAAPPQPMIFTHLPGSRSL